MTGFRWTDWVPLALLVAYWLGGLAFGVYAARVHSRDPARRAGVFDLWRRPERLTERGVRLRRLSIAYLYIAFTALMLGLWLSPHAMR